MQKKRLAIILGNCLFADHSKLNLDPQTLVFMAETKDLATHFKYHKQKITLFFSSMRSMADVLRKEHDVFYHEYTHSSKTFTELLLEKVKEHTISEIVSYTIEDHFFRDQMMSFAKEHNVTLTIVDSPGFITSSSEFKKYQHGRTKLLMNDFYVWQRKRLNILIDDQNKPIGGKWSFDEDNRKKLAKGVKPPPISKPKLTSHTKDVIELVKKEFADHPGEIDSFFYPTTHDQAKVWLDEFLQMRFEDFGTYEDAIESDQTFLFHSVLSPLLNCGLLTPKYVIDEAITYAEKHNTRLASVEGFIRQIVGWREFIRGTYHTLDFSGNFWGHTRSIPKIFYEGSTGITPIDDAIKKALDHGYTHHIERLMVIGNIMLLCEFDPKEVYKWFMEMYVDSADWVMEPNVYGMSQFSVGDMFATKPYICGSNYICKMSDYGKAEDWCEVVDGLYWRFIDKHRDFFKTQPRLSMMVALFDKMADDKRNRIIEKANIFIQSLDS